MEVGLTFSWFSSCYFVMAPTDYFFKATAPIPVIEIILVCLLKTQTLCNLIDGNSVHISDICNCYSANTNGL